ncbi:MAG: hypothetical protein JNG88_00440 [Phycisphaerales bacterium]|nr:hypothetical protein [Phycisphaerales bacterium]
MKRFLFAAMAACAITQFASAQNLLTNGDLELPLDAPNESNDADGWTLTEVGVDATGAPLDTASFVNFANHTTGGDRGLWFRSFMGGLIQGGSPTVDAILHQGVPATPGTQYTLSAWYRFEQFYSGGDPLQDTQTLLSLEFFDAGNVLLSASVLDVEQLVANGADWTQVTVSGTAPAGAASVHAVASFLDGVLETQNPQSAFVDDFVLVPEPTSLLLFAPLLLGLARRRG